MVRAASLEVTEMGDDMLLAASIAIIAVFAIGGVM
jgi:hypothetical protein